MKDVFWHCFGVRANVALPPLDSCFRFPKRLPYFYSTARLDDEAFGPSAGPLSASAHALPPPPCGVNLTKGLLDQVRKVSATALPRTASDAVFCLSAALSSAWRPATSASRKNFLATSGGSPSGLYQEIRHVGHVGVWLMGYAQGEC